ncbi:hypothetical protein [Spiroplasma endosymbiont of Clivina fossor]|uniref:hypothetical protein n=1 Tax=Spiroplasma endosymbiont of Clivina fossor TaxID=3066282 RepID=UPI00313F0734
MSFVYLDRYQLNKPQYFISSFSAKVPLQPEKDNEQPLPTEINKNDGEYDYIQFQDKLDYLMIQRRDFDKFNYSYLYWVPIFNFFDDNFKYMSEISIKLNGFKQNSKFNLSRKNSYPKPDMMKKVIFRELSFSSFGDVITIKTEHGSIVGYNEFLENGKSLWKSGSQTSFGGDFINTFFGQVNYYFNFVENSWYLLNILNFRYIFNMIEVANNYGKNNSRTSKYFNRWSIFRILWKSQTTSRINKKTKTFKWNWSKI